MKQEAKIAVRYEMGAVVIGKSGRIIDVGKFDDSFGSWRAIVSWNLHEHHWKALAVNARDLFTKVLRRKLWRRS